MTRKEIAENYFKQGFNCSQSVALAYSDVLKLDEEKVAMISSAFGGGFGRLREVCGAVSGMVMVIGSLKGFSSSSDADKKAELYAVTQELINKFKQENGSYICKDLLGLPEETSSPIPEKRTAEYYKKRPCVELVGSASEILEQYLKENGYI